MLAVNLRAGFVLGREAGRRMIERKVHGRILIITSLHAYTPRNLPHYSAAKAGQTMMMKELAKAFGPHGIRVNAIAPGAIPGGGFDAIHVPIKAADEDAVSPFNRLARPARARPLLCGFALRGGSV